MIEGRVLIVGAGQAGIQAALALRQNGFAGSITLYSDESAWPYDRPPLSKSFVAGTDDTSQIPLLSEADAQTNALDIVRGVSVVAIDGGRRCVQLSSGEQASFDILILATGGTARALPSLPADNDRVFALRTLADAQAIAGSLKNVRNAAVIGGGWLGLEIAAAIRAQAKDVTIFEAAAHVCQRSLPREVAQHLESLHEQHDVRIHTGAKVSFARERDHVLAQHGDSHRDTFDIAIVAIGLAPRTELARAAGLVCDDGILTDGAGRTNIPGIYAIGDVARLHHDGLQQALRLESWTNAAHQAALAAQAICGQQPSYTAAPWFWSEQYGRMVQVAGLPQPDLELLSVEHGTNPLWRYGRAGKLAAVIGIDRPRDVRMAARELTAQMSAPSNPDESRRSA